MYDKERVEKQLEKANSQGFLSGTDFSIFIQGLLISKDGWIIDVGNYETANAEAAIMLKEKIDKHPLIWSLFFMLC